MYFSGTTEEIGIQSYIGLLTNNYGVTNSINYAQSLRRVFLPVNKDDIIIFDYYQEKTIPYEAKFFYIQNEI